ncbi:universal stress protein [Tropicimonas sp. IMCC34043]|uniref:universal stress protein n=1 Tax=Tropicimonas sp. IMCC34043 TaxID=2248760 RepID=UPI000E269B83|nr:universal stress protein [Tropicimonas sp. IMCC34043]
MFKRILVPFDGSKGSEKALWKAIELAKLCDADLAILTVYRHHSMLEASFSMVRPSDPGNMDDIMRGHARDVAEFAKQQALDSNVSKVRAYVKAGYASRTITGFAKEHDYDLIIMGKRGLGSIEGYLVGSVAHKVPGTTECTVMLV